MPTFNNIQKLKELLKKEGFFLKPYFSQNILVNEAINKSIVAAADFSPGDTVLEVGPGLGFLTKRILPRVRYLLGVEKDRDFCKYLQKRFEKKDKFELIEGDILETNPQELYQRLLSQTEVPGKIVLAGNIPYKITTPILTHLIGESHPFSRAVLMVQREVAERLAANAGTKKYGAISVFIRYYSVPKLVRVVKRGNFYPVPSVDSAIVQLDFIQRKTEHINAELFSKLVRACFRTRRKTLKNALTNYEGLTYTKKIIEKCLLEAGLKGNERAEELMLEDYIKLYEVLINYEKAT